MLKLLTHDNLYATVTHYDITYEIEFTLRRNWKNVIEISASTINDGLAFFTATINADAPLTENQVIIKDYGENEGVLDILLAMGIITNAHQIADIRVYRADLTDMSIHILDRMKNLNR